MLGVLTIVVFTVLSADCDVTQRGRQRARPVLAASTSSRGRKPNIVLILTDDQDVELGSLNFMPKTLEAVRDQGATFRHAYVTTPMCCPSRSSLLTGMYVHNHHVYTNNDNCSSTQWQATHETRSFATYLSNAGYRTGYFGKYLNKYNGSYVPPGWREWGGLIMNSKYYNYSINMNGKKIKHGFDYHKDYYPDLIANDSIAFLRQSKKNSAHKPVMLTMSFPAPHGPEDSAPQYSHLFFNVTTHHTPSYDYAPNPDKQWILQVTQKMQPIHRQFTDLLMTKRLQTLQSVDEAVRRVVAELEALGELENTFVIYTSDHGYHLGQFGLIKGKSFPFEFDVRVPFLVRGPGVDAGSVVDDIVLNVDLAPTFLDIAGVETPPHMDGRSVLPLFLNKKRKRLRWPDTFLIESSGRRETPYLDAKLKPKKLSTEAPPSTAAPLAPSPPPPTPTTPPPRTTASPKIYDSGEDLTDSAFEEDEDIFEDADDDDDDDDVIEIDDELDDANSTNKIIRGEEGDMLDTRDLSSSKLERLAVECVQKEMSLPCRANQKWYCFNDNGRWRKHKCKSVTFQGSNNKPFRNCACFTTKGLIYRKIPRNITRRHTFYHRIKRDVDLDHILFTRRKRDTLAHVDSVLRHVQGQIKDLKDVNATLLEDRSNLETNTIYDASAACVMQKGRIHCPPGVYQDRKSWRQSRHQIDNEIYQLKAKLERLKVIRRHLKHVRPTPEEDLEPNVVEAAADGERNSTRKGKRRGPSAKRPSVESSTSHHHRHNHSFSDFEVLTTESPYSSTTSKLEEEDEEGGEEDQEEDTTDHCYCESETPPAPLDERDRIKELKRKEKEERLRRKLRKQRKKDQLERECGSERMNCFHHDDDHWRTAPLWAGGPFCFCMNANNNTYSCVRTINSTHNFLYCEFTTGLVTFYNLRIDPFELQNRVNQLGVEERSHLHDQLQRLMACRGAKSCTVNNGGPARARGSSAAPHVVPFPQHTSRYKKRKVVEEGEWGKAVGVEVVKKAVES